MIFVLYTRFRLAVQNWSDIVPIVLKFEYVYF